jgi:hypothetical protein
MKPSDFRRREARKIEEFYQGRKRDRIYTIGKLD